MTNFKKTGNESWAKDKTNRVGIFSRYGSFYLLLKIAEQIRIEKVLDGDLAESIG